MKVLILGGGWYGCFIALVCKTYNIDFLIFVYIFSIFLSSNKIFF